MKSVVMLTQNGKSTAIILPQRLQRQLRWYRGDHVAVFIENGMLIVANLESDIDRTRRAAADTAHAIAAETQP